MENPLRLVMMMIQAKWESRFIYSCGAIFTITAIAKIITNCGTSPQLMDFDPLIGIPMKRLLFGIATIELLLAAACYSKLPISQKAGLVAWVSTLFLVYRLGLYWMGYHKGCQCLGNITEFLHISAKHADETLQICLAYLLIGSYSTFFYALWSNTQRAVQRIE